MKKAAAGRFLLREAAEMRLSVFRYAACEKTDLEGVLHFRDTYMTLVWNEYRRDACGLKNGRARLRGKPGALGLDGGRNIKKRSGLFGHSIGL